MRKEREMICKKNWKLTKKYLYYRLHTDQISIGSYKAEETHIRYILDWADNTPFENVPSLVPTFPEFIQKAHLDGKKDHLSPAHIKKILSTARRLFSWLYENDYEFRTLKPSWVAKIRNKRLNDIPQNKEYVTIEEISRIAHAPAESLLEQRIRASAVFLFLSGMRVGAFVSLPIKAVDIKSRYVYQYTSLGVRTKNGKNAKTVLYNIPELLTVVEDWDNLVRNTLPDNGYWFAPFSPDTGEIDTSCKEIGLARSNLFRKNLKFWLEKVGLTYHSPHKFRHGHVHFGQAHSKTQEDYKAVSQNVMHSSTGVTDQFYSNMDDDMKKNRLDSMFA